MNERHFAWQLCANRSSWQEDAEKLSKAMAPIYLERDAVVNGLENLNRATREGDWELFTQADN